MSVPRKYSTNKEHMDIQELEKAFRDSGITNVVWDCSPQVQAVIDHPDFCKVDEEVLRRAELSCQRIKERMR